MSSGQKRTSETQPEESDGNEQTRKSPRPAAEASDPTQTVPDPDGPELDEDEQDARGKSSSHGRIVVPR